MKSKIALTVILILAGCGSFASQAAAGTASEINESVRTALVQLNEQIPNSAETIAQAKGVLVIPGAWKAGLSLGGQYGEGSLQIGGKVVDYYSLAGASFGFQIGVQKQTVVVAFMDERSLNEFHMSDGWQLALSGSAVLVNAGIDGTISTLTTNEPVIRFVIEQKGFMGQATVEGYKLTKLKK